MSAKTDKYLNLIVDIAFSVLTVIVGLLFIWQVIDIYVTGTNTGGTMYSPEIVAEHFDRVSPAFWMWIAMIVAVFVLQEVFPVPKKLAPYKDSRYTLKRLKKKCAKGIEGLEESYEVIRREERTIKILWLCCVIIIAVGVIYGIVYLAMPHHFPKDDVSGGMLSMVKNFAPFVGTAFLVAVNAAIYEGASAKKQILAAKEIVAKSKGVATPESLFSKLRVKIKNQTVLKIYDFLYTHRINIARVIVAVVSITFIIVGIFNGSMADVLKKAINICTECIGLG